MKTFIVPIDFSEESINGLKLAMMFSKIISVNIQMVYVLHYSSSANGVASKEVEMKYANRKFEKLVEEYEPQLKNDSKLRYIVKKGKIHKEIVTQAHSYNDAIICASTHGATGFKEAFIGSNTYKIVTATNLPVLTIRKSPCPDNFKKIVIPITSNRTTRQKIPFTKDLALLFGAEVYIVKIANPKNKKAITKVKAYANQVKGYFQAANVPIHIEERFTEHYSDEVCNYAKEVGADLITIMSDNTSRINLLLGNFAHRIVSNAEVPVLCLTPKLLGAAGSFSTFGG